MKRWFRLSRDAYADVLPPPLSDIEIARMWRGMGQPPPIARRRHRPPLLLGIAAAALAAAVAFVVVLLVSPGDAAAPGARAADVRLEDARQQLELPDGSRVAFATDTVIKALSFVADDVELQLVRGTAELTLAPAPAGGLRRFAVTAGGFELIPRSGRFRAAVVGGEGDRRIEVTVYEGELDIPQHRPEAPGPLTLSAGQTWSSEPLVSPGDLHGALPASD